MSVKQSITRSTPGKNRAWLAAFVLIALTIFITGNAFSAVTLSWNAPNSNTDGTPLTDLSGYEIYYGTSSGNYAHSVNVGNVRSYTFANLSAGTYYFVATAYNTSGVESAYSNEVIKTVASQYTLSIARSGTGSGTVSSSPAGINCGTSCSGLYNPGAVVTLTGAPAANSVFAGWSGGGCSGTGTCSFTVNANTTVTAMFTQQSQTYTITASAGTGGSISPIGAKTMSSGGSQTYTITPAAGYSIAGVTVDGTSVGAVASYPFSNVTADHTIAATFKTANATTYTITASAGTGGSISPAGTKTISSGGSQTYTITPATGYSVVRVTVDGLLAGTTIRTYNFKNVTANHTITATFTANTSSYTITASSGTGGNISPAGPILVIFGGSQAYTITPSSGYSIAGVTVDGVSVGAVSTYTFSNVKTNHTITATFKTSSGSTTTTTKTITLAPTSDTFINVDTINYSTSPENTTYTWPAQKVANAILMKFDLSAIPAGATIQSAALNLYMFDSDTNTAYPSYRLSLNRIINHNPDLSRATGYTYDGTHSWTSNTKAYNNIPLAQADISGSYNTLAVNQTAGFKSWDATQLISYWLTNPSANYGLMINSDPAAPADTFRNFASSQNATASWRPYLKVTYITK